MSTTCLPNEITHRVRLEFYLFNVGWGVGLRVPRLYPTLRRAHDVDKPLDAFPSLEIAVYLYIVHICTYVTVQLAILQ